MKQLALMIALTLMGTVGVLFEGPFIAVGVYYLFAVLRPQYIWQWALPADIAWSQYVAIAAIVGLLAYSLGAVPLRRVVNRRLGSLSITHGAFLGFALWVSLTYFTAQSQAVAWPWLLEYLKIFAMFFVAALVVRSVGQIWTLYLMATGALVYVAYEFNSLYFFDRRLDIYHLGYGGLDNNGAGLMVAMGVPLAFFAWEGSRRLWRWLFIATIPLLLHAVLMSYSRGAMIALLLTAPLLVIRSRHRLQCIVVAGLLAMTIPALAGDEIRQRFFSVAEYETDGSASSRFESWKAAIGIANAHPITGVGIRNSNLFSYDYGADLIGRTIHSQYFQILADEGYPGLALYLVVVCSFFVVVWRVRRRMARRSDHEALRAVAILNGVETSLLVFCIGGLFLSLEVFELPYLLILLGAQLAAVSRADAVDMETAHAPTGALSAQLAPVPAR
jgi:probable O-glycosylation ligase (exosortase A-associated)